MSDSGDGTRTSEQEISARGGGRGRGFQLFSASSLLPLLLFFLRSSFLAHFNYLVAWRRLVFVAF